MTAILGGETGAISRTKPLNAVAEVAGLLSVVAVGMFPVVRSLRVPDLNWCYPYLQYDS